MRNNKGGSIDRIDLLGPGRNPYLRVVRGDVDSARITNVDATDDLMSLVGDDVNAVPAWVAGKDQVVSGIIDGGVRCSGSRGEIGAIAWKRAGRRGDVEKESGLGGRHSRGRSACKRYGNVLTDRRR